MAAALGRSVMQQCLSAKLMVKPAISEDESAEYVQITRGVVMFVCFLKDASNDTVEKMVRSLLDVKLSYCDERKKRCSILELPGDILIVPQATLGGKMKGKVVQYHGNIEKCAGKELYHQFVKRIKEEIERKQVDVEKNQSQVKHGTYGNLQVLSMETNGPYTHIIDF